MSLVAELHLDYRVSSFVHSVRTRLGSSVPPVPSPRRRGTFMGTPSLPAGEVGAAGAAGGAAAAGAAGTAGGDGEDAAEEGNEDDFEAADNEVVENLTLTDDEAALVDQLSANSLGLQVLAGKRIVPILMDLTLYQLPELSTAAFEVLCRTFSQRKCFFDSISRMQLLVDSSSVETYKVLQDEVAQLRVLAENGEIWMQLAKLSDALDMRTTQELLNHIISLCYRCVCACVMLVGRRCEVGVRPCCVQPRRAGAGVCPVIAAHG